MKLKLWQGFLGASLLFLLTACPQTPAPPQSNATPSELSTALQNVGQDIQGTLSQINQELQQLLQGIAFGQFTPLGQGLQTLEQQLDPLVYLKQPIPKLQGLLGGILPQGNPSNLPRGVFECPSSGSCDPVDPNSDDLVIRYQTGSTWNKLLADWNYSSKGTPSPTVYVHNPSDTQGQYLQEMPTKAFGSLDLKEDGTNEGEATFQATWRPSTCLSGKYLTEPGNLSLTGFLQRPAGTGRLVDLPSLSLTTSASQLKLVWNLSLLTQGNNADLHTEGFIQINGSSTPGICGSLLEKFNASSGEVDVKLDTRNHAARLYFKITDWNENTGAITIQNGYLTVDGKTVTFAGVLDDANGNCVPGENLTLTFAGGQTMSLEAYLIQNLGASPCK
jgi:hypothetical protein